MKRSTLILPSLLGLLAALLLAAGQVGPLPQAAEPAPADEGWLPLFSGENLDGWYTWLPSTGRDDDPKGVFRVRDGMLHILDIPETSQDQEFGYLATLGEHASYRLQFEYRWDRKRFPPRAAEKRDSGLLYHVVGPDAIWPRSVECQVQEGDTGDFFLIDGTALSTRIASTEADPKTYRPDGVPYTQTGGRIVKGGTYDSPTDWNTVEIIAAGDEAVHVVNGRVNNRATDLRQPDPHDPNRTSPLTGGRILLQAEGAEVFYRHIRIKPLNFAAPPPASLVLVDGTTTSHWQPRAGEGSIRWPVTAGALEVCPGCGDVRTVETFRDFRLHVEFRVPETTATAAEQDRGNSGIYLQGRYELQVLDSFNRELRNRNDAGAIYGVKDAAVNAGLPAETWQVYDITFRAARWSGGTKTENARVTVLWNAVRVHDDVEIPSSTGGGDEEGPEPGPIVLRDHGQPVRYRNLWIEPAGQ